MILVTGATGHIGSALTGQLRAHGAGPVRALTRNTVRAAFPAGVEAVEGDVTDPVTWQAALDGVRAVFLLSSLAPDAETLRAARDAGVEHAVLVSSLTVRSHPHLGPARQNLRAEQTLQDSGLDWTVLRPTQFASNTLMWAESVRAGEPVRAPYADTALPTVHPADIAAVARVALTEPGHRGRTYELTGPAPVSPRDQVAALAAAVGREVPFEEISREQARAAMVEVFGAEAADAILDLTGGDTNEELLRVRGTVARVTGTQARPFRRWAEENADAFRAGRRA
ncbi:SDR family oxidoreductase [Streptomyces boluensis]|uniref:NAD(P)H-binding protein n=1 Tax=Streptomyces boluensis TaxID=1775135 RepID=A0A964V2P0_9ACTN|nr:NAD(P)H-binding protein [Streptomyces boluensis]NBE56040.1 NAD(P)H-binding protein [Streptomyces boluensis]